MKTNLDELFSTSKEVEKNGIWFNIGDGLGFRIKRFGGYNSSEMKKAYAKFYKPYAKLIEKGLLPEEKEKEINTQVWVESCLIDWRGVEIDGKEEKFSSEKAVELMVKLPELLDTLVDMSQDTSNFKEEVGK